MFKKAVSFFISCAILMTGTVFPCFAETTQITTSVSVPPKIVFLGDSIAAGYGLDGYSDTDLYNCQSYAVILGEKYKTELAGICDETMINDAVSGDTSEQLLSHIKSGEFDKDLKDTDVVVISIGGNDILGLFLDFLMDDVGITPNMTMDEIKEKFSSLLTIALSFANMTKKMDDATENFGTNIDELISQINTRTDNAAIIFQTQYNPLDSFDDVKIISDLAAEKIGNINKQITSHAVTNDKTNYIIADVYTEFSGKSQELTNIGKIDIHPNSEGHKLIADIVDKAVRTQKYTVTQTVEVEDKADISDIILVSVICLFVGGIVILITVKIILKKKKAQTERT